MTDQQDLRARLPKLPKGWQVSGVICDEGEGSSIYEELYTADQMRAYALEAAAQLGRVEIPQLPAGVPDAVDTRLRPLLSQWRKQADEERTSGGKSAIQFAEGLRYCATDLEFALAGIIEDSRGTTPQPDSAALTAQQKAPEGEEECETCEGRGWHDERLGGYSFSNPKAPCPDCDGTGQLSDSAAPGGDVPYDRELIASMLDAAVRGNSGYSPDFMTKQAELLRAADRAIENGAADAMHWIDRYAAGWDAECQLDRVADALLSRTPDGAAPDGGGVEQMARELLQRLMDAPYGDTTAGNMICAEALFDRLEAAWLPVITAALSAPKQVGVVPDAKPSLKCDDEGNGEYNYNEGWNDCRAAMLATSPQPAPVPAEGEGREPTVAHRWLDDLRLRMEHCVSAAEEGEDYSVSREFLSAMTTLGLMKKVGRGKWAPTDAGSDLANAKPTLPVEIHGKLYEVPIPVQLHIVNLRDKISATPPPEQPAIELEEIRSLARHWRIQDSQIGQGSAGNKARRRCSDELIALIDGAKAGRGSGVECTIGGWIHEDQLPEGYPYNKMFPFSGVDTVRIFPVYVPIATTPDAEGNEA